MHSKGMSQTLALIVAASVLMMTALTVIFMVQGGLGDVMSSLTGSSCQGTMEAKCTNRPDTDMVTPPDSCFGENDQKKPSAPNYVKDGGGAVECRQVTGGQ